MRRMMVVSVVLAVGWLVAAVVWAGSPHFVECRATTSGNVLSVDGKEAGLGSETQVHIEVTAIAECINRGNHNPSASNKTTVAAEGDFPVQNGKALFSFDIEAQFQPSCSPPMTVEFSAIVVCDTEHNVCCSL